MLRQLLMMPVALAATRRRSQRPLYCGRPLIELIRSICCNLLVAPLLTPPFLVLGSFAKLIVSVSSRICSKPSEGPPAHLRDEKVYEALVSRP